MRAVVANGDGDGDGERRDDAFGSTFAERENRFVAFGS
jgi:hypothetical protein